MDPLADLQVLARAPLDIARDVRAIAFEEMVQRLDRRTVVLERAVVDLQNKADRAMRLLPDPDDDNRTVLEKAKDVIAGT